MEAYRERVNEEQEHTPEKIDLIEYLQDIYRGVCKFWWLVIVLTVVFAARAYFSTTTSYQPNYVASATVSINGVSGNSQSASDMAEVFPYILTSGVLSDVISEDMDLESLPGSINVQAVEGLNLLTISVSSADPQMAYEILMSVIKNYPQVAEFVLGKTELTILDQTGIPTDTQRVKTIRGSYKRGALKGAILGCVIILLYALSRRTVKSRAALKKHLNIPDMGSIPGVRVKKRKKETFRNAVSLLNERLPQSYLESLRKLRIRVVREMNEKQMQTLMVTSSIPGEGKTTLAVNLAISMAEQGQRVILLDCDVRNPSVAGVLNDHEQRPGLLKVLKKESTIKQAMYTVDIPKENVYGDGSLRVICGGEAHTGSAAILGTKTMGALLKHLEKDCDILILDTAPSGLLADAPILAKYVDAALYVIRYDYTKLRQIREGVQILALSGVDIFGYVFNGDRSSRARGYGYSYGYGKYGKYGYGGYGGYGSYSNRRYKEKVEEDQEIEELPLEAVEDTKINER